MRNPSQKEDHHLERDHWGRQEMLRIEKLPKSSASSGNDVRGEAKHAKESLQCSFSAKAYCVVRVRGGVNTGAESSSAGSLGSESLFAKLIPGGSMLECNDVPN